MSAVSAWGVLLGAGILEIVWAIALKQSAGFSRLWPSVITIVVATASFWLLAIALRHLPVGTAYAVWTGIGALGVALIGMLWLGEPASTARILCILLIVAGIVGLKITHA